MTVQKPKHREEVINVHLAALLEERGLEANAETISKKGRPDVLINLDGLKLVLEGRHESQRESLLSDAQKRVTEGLADISMGVLYHPSLYTATSTAELRSRLEDGSYSGAVFFFDETGIGEQPFTNSSLDNLVETINRVFLLRVQNDVVRTHVKMVEEALDNVVEQASVTSLFYASEALVARLRTALGIEDA